MTTPLDLPAFEQADYEPIDLVHAEFLKDTPMKMGALRTVYGHAVVQYLEGLVPRAQRYTITTLKSDAIRLKMIAAIVIQHYPHFDVLGPRDGPDWLLYDLIRWWLPNEFEQAA